MTRSEIDSMIDEYIRAAALSRCRVGFNDMPIELHVLVRTEIKKIPIGVRIGKRALKRRLELLAVYAEQGP